MRFKRWFRYEFWPFWLFYFPTYFYWIYLAFRSQCSTYFTAANPIFNNGGAVNVSKYGYLKRLPSEWVPPLFRFSNKDSMPFLMDKMKQYQLTFPLILKPDRGERGKGVHLVSNREALEVLVKKLPEGDFLLQAYSTYENEVGILYYRYPHEKEGRISSITTKSFCKVIGDGQRSWGSLIAENIRVNHRLEVLKQRFKKEWNLTSVLGEELSVEPIGSHNLGTMFLDGSSHHSTALERQLDHMANQLPGFYFGRFDIRLEKWDSFLKGEKFNIIEINGVNAEPTHIYDPNFSIWKAYRTIFSQMKIIYEISNINHKLGVKTKSLKFLIIELIQAAKA